MPSSPRAGLDGSFTITASGPWSASATSRRARTPSPPDKWEEAFVRETRDQLSSVCPHDCWSTQDRGVMPADENVKQFLHLMADPKNRPVLVHCFRGRPPDGHLLRNFPDGVRGLDQRGRDRGVEGIGLRQPGQGRRRPRLPGALCAAREAVARAVTLASPARSLPGAGILHGPCHDLLRRRLNGRVRQCPSSKRSNTAA